MPDDHPWCVATEIDLDSTYLGAAQGCIEELAANSELEVMPLSATAGITADSDTLNPAPPRGSSGSNSALKITIVVCNGFEGCVGLLPTCVSGVCSLVGESDICDGVTDVGCGLRVDVAAAVKFAVVGAHYSSLVKREGNALVSGTRVRVREENAAWLQFQ